MMSWLSRAALWAFIGSMAPNVVSANNWVPCPGGLCPPTSATPGFGQPIILCRGDACRGVIDSLLRPAQGDPFEVGDEPIGAGHEQTISTEQFCQLLRDKPPERCSATGAPPRVPGVNQTVQDFANDASNGCGSGTLREGILSSIGPFLLEGFSGDMNSPWANSGVSFRPACLDHDVCYSSFSSRPDCDASFAQGLATICSQNYVSGSGPMNTCMGWADTYSGAVRTQGQQAYQDAQDARQCALYHEDLERMGCK
jgi:hypothetical protein